MSKILKELGRGAFGVVYLLQTADSSKFALKVVRQTRPREDDLKEAKILTECDHPHLVKCFQFFKKGSALYLITEYCTQGTLNDYILQQKHYLQEKTVLRMLCQLSDVLRYLHAKNIIHRDLKPANIFLDLHKDVKVGDVGVARCIPNVFQEGPLITQAFYFHRQLDYTSEEASSITGALPYMSPEIHGQKKYTSKVDVWSLGCCVHEMMTLKRTFNTVYEVIQLKIPVMPRDIYSQSLETLVLDMLSEDPAKRPDAHSLLFKASAIRGKHYKSGDLVTSVELAVQPREICEIVTRYEAAHDHSSSSEELETEQASFDSYKDDSEDEATVRNDPPTVIDMQRKSSDKVSKGPFPNLKKDTLGTIPTKSNRHRKGSRSLSTESSGSDLTEQNDFTDNSLSSYRLESASSMEDAETSSWQSTQTSLGRNYAHHEYALTSDSDSSVTLYTRAQHARYKNRLKQDTQETSASDLARCTEDVFAEQSDSLKELMLKRVAGIQTYKVDGKPMLRHQPF
ncbi:serine/threonine-protein kinase Nek4 [Elysia marginata]|uniref:non-specific serine/threonine protein kinase n=1 Tax=Elysia marginata TaxID=1093978 RepID=A0AAV4F0U2_9GAST|nr:serine/threonine-protein kinase Nek4 [Elysia marginata]